MSRAVFWRHVSQRDEMHIIADLFSPDCGHQRQNADRKKETGT
jgi:hypothetical protein